MTVNVPDPTPGRSGQWWAVFAVGSTVAILGAVTTLILALNGGGDNGNGTSDPPATTQAQSVAPTSTSVESDDRVEVSLFYAGDTLACTLAITVEIGDQTAVPAGSVYTMRDVASGRQSYSVRGNINCPVAGACVANGAGSLDIEDRDQFEVVWVLAGVGQCNVVLEEI